jgi:hypothetical protein
MRVPRTKAAEFLGSGCENRRGFVARRGVGERVLRGNQISYERQALSPAYHPRGSSGGNVCVSACSKWRPQRDSNSCYRRERAMS